MAVKVAIWIRTASKTSKPLRVLSIKSNAVFYLEFGLKDDCAALYGIMPVHSASVACQDLLKTIFGQVTLLITAKASHRRALSVWMVAKTMNASEHRRFYQTVLCDMTFFVATITLYQPVSGLLSLLKVTNRSPSLLQVNQLLFLVSLNVFSRVFFYSLLQIKLTNEPVHPTSLNLISQESTVICLFTDCSMNRLFNFKQFFILFSSFRRKLCQINFCPLDLASPRKSIGLPFFVHIHLYRLIVGGLNNNGNYFSFCCLLL